jgi:hypothetical protein
VPTPIRPPPRRRGRVGQNRVGAEGNAQRLADHRRVGRDILSRDQSAVRRTEVLDQRFPVLRHLRVGIVFTKGVQEVAKFRVGQAIAGFRQLSTRKEEACHGGRVSGDRGDQAGNHRDLRTDPEAVACPGCRRCHDLAQRPAAGATMQGQEADKFAGNCRCRFADVKDLCGLSKIDGDRRKVQIRLRGQSAPRRRRKEIEHFVAIVGIAPEADATAAKRCQREFGHRCRELGSDDRVDRVAAVAQEARAGNRRMRLRRRDHPT